MTAFFKEVEQMGLSNCPCRTISAEGIATPDNLAEFTNNGLESMFHNLRKPPKKLAIRAQNGVPIPKHAGILTEVQPYVVAAKSKM